MRRVADRVTKDPHAWESARGEVLETFDAMASDWESRLGAEHLIAAAAGLRSIPPPASALDLGCGTGLAADLVSSSYPDAVVVGLDLSLQMVRAAVAKPRPTAVRFLAGDATALPFPDACFGFITILNGFIFPAEVARVLAPRGWLLIAYSSGEDTPIYVPADEIERLCASVGLVEVAHGRAEPGTLTTARRPA